MKMMVVGVVVMREHVIMVRDGGDGGEVMVIMVKVVV